MGSPRVVQSLSGVQQTLLIPLSARVIESRRADTTFRDPEAERIAQQLEADLAFFGQEWTQVEVVVGRTAIFDRGVKEFMAAHPGGQVVSLGAGLCTRFHRLDDGAVRWLDVDLPDVMEIKSKLLPATDRYRHFAGSVLDDLFLDQIAPGPVLFVAEGLLMYFDPADVASLLTRLARRSPGGEMWLEAISPLLLRTFGRRSRTVRATGATFRWGLREASELAAFVPGLTVLEIAHPNQVHPERWRWMRIFRFVPVIHEGLKCVHLRLPERAE